MEKKIVESKLQLVNIITILFAAVTAFFVVISIMMFSSGDSNTMLWVCLALFFGIVTFVIHWALSRSNITVTDKRVYGTAILGKRVDLPLNKISAVGTSLFKGIDIGTSAGRIHFKMIANNLVIHSAISALLLERQESDSSAQKNQTSSISNADELKKYKDLLDSGVISQEEFDEKKKQILGL